MSTLTYTRRTLPPEYSNYKTWPAINTEGLEDRRAKRIEKLQTAVISYLDGTPITATCKNLGISKAEVLRVLNNCIRAHPDGRVYGWRALEFGNRIKGYRRIAQTSAKQKGLAGALGKLFGEYPNIKNSIDILILKKAAKGVIHESRIQLKTIHEEFVRLCAEANISLYEYPFNTVQKGRRALERYTHALRMTDFASAARILGGSNAATMAQVGTGCQSLFLPTLPFDACMADAHRLDFIGAIAIPTPKTERWIPINRMQFLPIVDVVSTALLGYTVVIADECSANDLLAAASNALSVWQPRQLRLAGMRYPTGAGFPSSLIPELAGACWSSLMVDNATIHYSGAGRERLRRRTGGAVNWGPIHFWPRRALIEAIFSALERNGFQRLPNSTGSHPKDSRRDDPAAKAIQHKMHYQELIDLLDIVCATHNITGRKDLGARSPIQLLQDFVSHPATEFLPRHLPELPPCIPDFDVVVQTVTARGDVSKGRRPYVQLDGVHYTSPLLAQAPSLIGTKLAVHIDENDFRTIKAFLPGGGELGLLMAIGAWGRVKHDRATRKHVQRLMSRGELVPLPGEEPIQAYLRAKGAEALQKANGSKSKIHGASKQATNIARTLEKSGVAMPEIDVNTPRVAAFDKNQSFGKLGKDFPAFIRRIQHRGF